MARMQRKTWRADRQKVGNCCSLFQWFQICISHLCCKWFPLLTFVGTLQLDGTVIQTDDEFQLAWCMWDFSFHFCLHDCTFAVSYIFYDLIINALYLCEPTAYAVRSIGRYTETYLENHANAEWWLLCDELHHVLAMLYLTSYLPPFRGDLYL